MGGWVVEERTDEKQPLYHRVCGLAEEKKGKYDEWEGGRGA